MGISYKFIVFSLMACMAVITNAYSQSKDEIIKIIRNKFTTINRDTGYKKITLIGEDFLDHVTDGGAELTGFFKEHQIRKIRQEVGISYGIETKEFYYADNQLIFVYETFNAFINRDSLPELNYEKTERSFEGRYYFRNNKLVDYITTGHNRFEDDILDAEGRLLAESNNLITLLSKKRASQK